MARWIREPAALPDSGVSAGTFTNATVTVNSQGIITFAASGVGGGGGPVAFNDLSDVSVATATALQIVQLNGAGTIWEPIDLELNALADVTLASPVADEVLSFDGSKWINATLSSLTSALTTGDLGVTVQDWDADLDGLAALAGTGFVVHTGPGTFTERSVLGGEGIAITNDDGVAGDATVDMDIIGLSTTAPINLVDANADFVVIYNTDLMKHEKILIIDLVTDLVSAGGLVIGATNIGAGADVFSANVAGTLQFRTIDNSNTGIVISQTVDEIEIGVTAGLEDISLLTPSSDVFIVGNGTNWTSQVPSVVRATLGLGTMALEANTDFLRLTGGTMSGQIDMGGNKIIDLGAPVFDLDAATKKYVDDQIVANAIVDGAGLAFSGLTLDVGAGTGITVNANDVALDTTFTDARYHTQTVLADITGGTEGADLIGTDAKTNLGGATTVEEALEFLNTVRFRQDISVWNLNITQPTAQRQVVNDVEVARFLDAENGAIYKDLLLPPDFDASLAMTLHVSMAKAVASSGQVDMALAWQHQRTPGFSVNATQSFDGGMITDVVNLSWVIPSSTFLALDTATLRLTRLGTTDTYSDEADFFAAFITQ